MGREDCSLVFITTSSVRPYMSWFIDMLLESAGGERIFEPSGVCVGVRVEMKVDIPDDAVCAFNCHMLNKK